MDRIINETFMSALPWWAWMACGVVSLYLARAAGNVSEDSGSTVAELANWLLNFLGIIFVMIGIVVVAGELSATLH